MNDSGIKTMPKCTEKIEDDATRSCSEGTSANSLAPAVSPVLRDVGKLAAGVAAVATGSATGNPRNKHALQPGHSLMDWIRLGQSGRDLSGVGSRAGTLNVSPKQLAEHCFEGDAWIAIRGKVYNVTAYLPFHPGGKDELMKGVGKDATQLFNEVHAWVNYESILQKCLVGRLTALESNTDTEALFYGKETTNNSKNASLMVTAPSSTELKQQNSGVKCTIVCPRFEWIQKSEYITTIFYTKSYCNPEVQITAPTTDNKLDVIITYDSHIFTNSVKFFDDIHWPCTVKITQEVGKVEVNFRKICPKVWCNFGTIKQTFEQYTAIDAEKKFRYIVLQNSNKTYNSKFLSLQRYDGVKQITPIGSYVQVFDKWEDQVINRAYSTVPSCYGSNEEQSPEQYQGDVNLIIKYYPLGMLTPVLCAKKKGDIIEVSPPKRSFDLRLIKDKDAFLFLTAGTGITPMFGIFHFLLERRLKKCQKITLICFNRTEEDIICKEELNNLYKTDTRFKVQHVLSEAANNWTGLKGHISSSIIKSAIDDQCKDTQLFPVDIYSFVCGPTVFTNLSKSLLTDIGYQLDQFYCFT